MPLLEHLEITNYRLFDQLTVDGLTRVNLLVGRNNAGKTALLEAVEAVVSEKSPFLHFRSSFERGEARRRSAGGVPDALGLDVRRWFRGHTLVDGASFTIKASGHLFPQVLTCRLEAIAVDAAPETPYVAGGYRLLTTRSSRGGYRSLQPVSPDGWLGAPHESAFVDFGYLLRPPVAFVTTRRQTAADLMPLWSRVLLTPAEEDVRQALTAIDPAIERVALSVVEGSAFASVLLTGASEPVPIGSLGEGTSRMLGLALNLACARGGYFLVDEIDTGLHYTVLVDMWRLIVETARRLDIQVFATTHSLDCVHALASLVEKDKGLAGDVSLHRIERGYERTTPYTAAEIVAAAKYGSELR